MEEDNFTFEYLVTILPERWKEKAKELGALQRSRQIKTAEDLLKLIFLYLTEGKSFGKTSALLSTNEGCHLTKKAIYTRVSNSAEWLRWLCENLCRESRMLAEKPSWLEGKTVYLADASDESVYGSSKGDYRLLYSVGLFDLSIKEMHLADAGTGEQLSNFQRFTRGDLVIADRTYGTIEGIEYLGRCGSDFLLGYRTGAFNLYTGEHESIEAADFFQEMEPGSCGAVTVYYKQNEEYKPIRLCGIGKTEKAPDQMSAAKGVECLKETNPMKMQDKPPPEAQLANSRNDIVITSLHESDTELIMQLYCFRRQMEQVFKRVKSMFGHNQIPSKVEESTKAWFYGKLLLAATAVRFK
jgi:hypothetical protein